MENCRKLWSIIINTVLIFHLGIYFNDHDVRITGFCPYMIVDTFNQEFYQIYHKIWTHSKIAVLNLKFEQYCYFPNFSDGQVWANSADPDQTASDSGSTMFAIPSASFGCITLRKTHLGQLLG